MSQLTDHRVRKGFRVVGPNLADGSVTTWYMETLEEARKFADGIAQRCDAEYDILQYVGTVRQVPLPLRPLEWLETPEKSQG